jgi:hypothetical protein
MIILATLLMVATSVVAYAADSATIPYEELKYVAGDVNCNEKIETADADALKKILLDIEDAVLERTADANSDGSIDICDVVYIRSYTDNNA